MSQGSIGKIIDPSDPVRGKLFPLWVLKTFHDLYLEKEHYDPNIDPCKETIKNQKALRPYQQILGRYLTNNSPYTGVLVYHGLGSGKTAGAINLVSILNADGDYNVFILLPAALKKTWTNEISSWLSNPEETMKSITFISTNASYLDTQFMEAVRKADSTKKMLFMIDEAHNFISNVYTNISGRRKGRAVPVYDYIYNEVLSNPTTKVVLLSGTPIKNSPFEASLIYNLLRPGCLPKDEMTFNDKFMKHEDNVVPILNPSRKHLFQRRIVGLTSYFKGSSTYLYAKKSSHFINIPMGKHQIESYEYFEAIEKKAEAVAISMGKKSPQAFKTTTRLSSNFVFPNGSDKRPRPAQFRLSSKDDRAILSGEEVAEDRLSSVKKYTKALKSFMADTVTYFRSVKEKDNGNIRKDIDAWKSLKEKNFETFANDSSRSLLFQELSRCSMKMTAAVFYALASPGQVLFYSNFVLMEGLEVLSMYLEMVGAKDYVHYHGSVNKDLRETNLEQYNKGKARFMLLSSAGSEGISLRNVRTVIILEPSWSEDMIQQVIGRAIRQCSHKDLPVNERHVNIYRLKSVLPKSSRPTTDEHIEDQALRKNTLKQSFLDAIKASAIDCDLFKNQNDLEGPCFRHPMLDFIKEKPGPSYLKDIEEESKVSPNTIRLKVKKIFGMLKGKKTAVLLDEETGVVFSSDFHIPIGKVRRDKHGFFEKYDDENYLIQSIEI